MYVCLYVYRRSSECVLKNRETTENAVRRPGVCGRGHIHTGRISVVLGFV